VKHLFLLPIALALVAAATLLIVRQTTGDDRTREIAVTLAIVVVSVEFALIPITLARHAGPVAVFQAALGGTVIHLFFCIGAGGACYALNWVSNRSFFLFLLLGFYWISLIGMIFPMLALFRQSAARAQQALNNAAGTLPGQPSHSA